MTVINNNARDQYTANNGQTIFNYTFEISDQDNIQVYQRAEDAAPDDVADLLTLGVDYTVTGVGVNTGGTIILTVGATLNDIVTLQGNAPPVRSTTFTAGGVIQAANLNTEFDDEILIYQTILATQDFLIPKYPKSAVVQDFDIVLPILGADQVWVMNTANDEIVAADFPSDGAANKLDTYVTMTDETSKEPNSFPLSGIGTGYMVNLPGDTNIVTRVLTGTANQIAISNPTGEVGNPTFSIVSNPIIPGTAGMGIPQGSTAQRVTPVSGIGLRYNTDLAALEYWDGSTWVQLDDADLSQYLLLSGGTMTGDISMGGGFRVVDALDPVDPQDYATKNYVDAGGGSPPFLPLAGGTMAGDIDMDGNGITNLVDPTLAQDAVTKIYVDTLIAAVAKVFSARLATTVALTVTYNNGSSGVGATLTNAGAMAALSVDGVAAVVGDRILFKNQASALQNGYYVVTDIGSGATNWVATRSALYDQPSEIEPGDLFVITAGSTQTGTSWIQTATVTAVGVDAINFSQYSVALPIPVTQGGTGLTSTTINQLLYSSSNNVIAGLPTANDAVLITSGAGVPSLSATLPAGLTIPGYALITSMQNESYNYILDTGAADAYVATLSPAVTSYVAGQRISLKIANTNITATPTVNVNGLGTKTIVREGNLPLLISDLITGMIADLRYDGTNYQLLNPASPLQSFNAIAIQRTTAPGAGTYTPTAGMKFVIVCAQGAGGGSGGAATAGATQFALSAGGAGGEYIEAVFEAVAIGASKPFVVGAGGTAGAAGNNAGTAGGDTTFNTTFVVAKGGGLGAGGASAAANQIFQIEGGATSGGSVATGVLIKQVLGGGCKPAFALGTTGLFSGGGNAGCGTPGARAQGAGSAAGIAGTLGAGASGAGTYNTAGQLAGAAGGDGFITFIEFLQI